MADDAGHCTSTSEDRRSHFLVAAYGYQGHLNPSLSLARRLARGGARVTLSVAVSAHARMFPASPDAEASDGVISYVPYSDGFGFGERPRTAADRARRRRVTADSLSAIVRRLAAAGRPVTCVVSALLLPAADVALEHGVPLAVFWNQSAATLAAYYLCFHGHDHLVAAAAAAAAAHDPATVRLPGLPPLRVRDLPSFLVDDATTGGEGARAIVDTMRELLEIVGREKPVVLVNTMDVLEPEAVALRALRQQNLEVIAVGPMLPTDAAAADDDDDDEGRRRIDLYEHDGGKGYTAWLDARPRRSVVYVSFGSMLGYTTEQVREMLRGLRECRRPYLWVVPRNGRDDGEVERCLMTEMDDCGGGERGMVVEWCDQLKVLAHPSTGCFVTHCGWNSTLEALVYGVPMVAVPNWSDQPVNAHLVEGLGVGVRAERDAAAGLLVGTELARCVAVVTSDGEEGMSIRNRSSFLKDKVRTEVIDSGLTEFRLQKFIYEMQNSM